MFWSGADFHEENLGILGDKFKDASIFYNDISEANLVEIKRWLVKARDIQRDYKNLVKLTGKLELLKS